ncbi:MAG TPA: transposase [Dehalococcoidia bacterium]|nr:transposase [Dehalococcoidia bacterium]
MPQERFRETGKDSFFGDLVYDRVVPKTTSSASSTRWWIGVPSPRSWCGTTKGATEYGPPPYEPVLLLKMLLLSYLYDLSERQTEELVTSPLPAKGFVGLAVDETALDLEAALGASAEFWLNLESTYRLTLVRNKRRAHSQR